jgi:hypothetical protein
MGKGVGEGGEGGERGGVGGGGAEYTNEAAKALNVTTLLLYI